MTWETLCIIVQALVKMGLFLSLTCALAFGFMFLLAALMEKEDE